MTSMTKAMFCVAAALVLTSCATTVRGTSDVLIVESDPVGAEVTVSHADGSTKARGGAPASGRTPTTFKLARKGTYVVQIVKEGYEPVQVTVNHKVAGGGSAGMAGNLLFGGLIGAAVDAGSGAMFDLVPNPIKVTLVQLSEKVEERAPAADAPTSQAAVFTAADRIAAGETMNEMRTLATALIAYRQKHGSFPEGSNIAQVYAVLARESRVRIADHWGKAFGLTRTADGFLIVSAGADGTFDESTWTTHGSPADLNGDAVLRVSANSVAWVRGWS